MSISLDKEYRTRSGLRVKLYRINEALNHPVKRIFGQIQNHEGEWNLHDWERDGKSYQGVETFTDLIEVSQPPKSKGWLNVYQRNSGVYGVTELLKTPEEVEENKEIIELCGQTLITTIEIKD